jgi:hypothetical protein
LDKDSILDHDTAQYAAFVQLFLRGGCTTIEELKHAIDRHSVLSLRIFDEGRQCHCHPSKEAFSRFVRSIEKKGLSANQMRTFEERASQYLAGTISEWEERAAQQEGDQELTEPTLSSLLHEGFSSLNLPQRVRTMITEFLLHLDDRGCELEQVILYGSQADGTAHPWSDIDIVVVSEYFANMPTYLRKSFLAETAIEAKTYSIQALAFVPSEWRSSELAPFPRLVRRIGRTILHRPNMEGG